MCRGSASCSRIAVSSVIIATIALHIAFTQGETDSYFRNLQNEPIIIFSYNENVDDPDFDFIGFELENRGPGHALIANKIALIDQQGDYEFISLEKFLKNKPKEFRIWRNHGYMVFQPGEKKKLLWIESSEYDEKVHKQWKDYFRKVLMVIAYASQTGKYQLCFITNLQGPHALREDTIAKLKQDHIESAYERTNAAHYHYMAT
ncbi:MAG: hypothetical protein HF978_12035 [Desulfobacteraceae bacterium]|nr:hypothetical protein [Desulfobacteraceae bacterium]MBC2756266.1 hypothetical protein [Desulfobacteraceae bacterium]